MNLAQLRQVAQLPVVICGRPGPASAAKEHPEAFADRVMRGWLEFFKAHAPKPWKRRRADRCDIKKRGRLVPRASEEWGRGDPAP